MRNFKVLSSEFLVILFLFFLLTTYYLLPTTVNAQVDLRSAYPFGRNPNTQTLGGGVSMLVIPAFSVAAVLVTFYFLVGALNYIISRGEKEQLQKARNMMTHAIIGFIILVAVFFVMGFLTESFGLPNIFG